MEILRRARWPWAASAWLLVSGACGAPAGPRAPTESAAASDCPKDVGPLRLAHAYTRYPGTAVVSERSVFVTSATSFVRAPEIAAQELPLSGAPMVERRAPGWPGSDCIAVDAASLYWTYHDGTSARCIALDETHAYWSDAKRGALLRVPKTGGETVVLAGGWPRVVGVALDATRVYWSSVPETLFGDLRERRPHPLAGTLLRMPLGGGPVTVLTAGASVPASAVPASPEVERCRTRGCVLAVPKTGGAPSVVWSDPDPSPSRSTLPGDLAVDDRAVYVATNRWLLRLPHDGGPPEVLATGLEGAVGTTVDGGEVFWGEINGAFDEAGRNVNGATVRKVATTGGEPTVLLRGVGVGGLALDRRYVYAGTACGVVTIAR